MKLLCHWCRHTIASVTPFRWAKHNFCSKECKDAFIVSLKRRDDDELPRALSDVPETTRSG